MRPPTTAPEGSRGPPTRVRRAALWLGPRGEPAPPGGRRERESGCGTAGCSSSRRRQLPPLDHPGRAAPLVRHLHRAQSALARQPAQGAAGVPRRGCHGCRVSVLTIRPVVSPCSSQRNPKTRQKDSEVPSTLYPQTGESPRESSPHPSRHLPGQSTSPARLLPPSSTLLTAVRRAPKPPHRIQHGQGKRCARPCRRPRARAILIKGAAESR